MKANLRLWSKTILLVAIALFSHGCNEEEQTLPSVKMTVSASEVVPYQIIKLALPGKEFSEESYEGKFGDTEITAVRTTSDTLAVMIPYLVPDTYTLTIFLGDNNGIADMKVNKVSAIENPYVLLNDIIEDASNAVSDLEELAASNGQTISSENLTLLDNMANSFTTEFDKLSESDQLQFAQFIYNNPDIFDSTPFSSSKADDPRLVAAINYYRLQIVRIGTAGAGFDILTYSAPGWFKVAGLACGVFMVEQILETLAYTQHLILDEDNIPYPGEMLTIGKEADFIFQNNQAKTLNISITYRTMCSDDNNSSNSLVKLLINYLDQFQAIWDKFTSVISKIKTFFGFSEASVINDLPMVSEITTYKTGTPVPGDASKASITEITNPNVAVTVVPSGSQLKVKFSTTQSSDQSFSFKYGYTDGDLTFERTYTAILKYENDIDLNGHIYNTKMIGNKLWMTENLMVTKYNDGTAIQKVTDSNLWGTITTGAYCNYKNSSNADSIITFGRLYNWYAVNTGKLCPAGWHVATTQDWKTLINYPSGSDLFGGKLKEAGTNHWKSPNTGATNETGFTALPGGDRNSIGGFSNIGEHGQWWSQSGGAYDPWLWIMGYDNSIVMGWDTYSIPNHQRNGYSVRCVKD